ncbi:hypothetical protein A3A93_04285 [Candidatus Roizmanbacteria bacterium RIFCSPLOWO2_01_FULL_38_12]|uniref:HD domain-containing protein n=1 Tax=Candidatus Roizmanbacteria bacterium RIFCSPLOWO2_01_FULL_38_12 TaxID=1802061 RepID=A0A1F7IX95_9BACT|nr:MAG: hypothetical protein A3A93_04285 [Candidatus Roizmanbacteria bacterium RIFCSPLOWO2_01_FULL_38_12]
MRIIDIYRRYMIMPNLQQHMFRVAAVGSVICDSISEKVDSDSIVAACLLHDMGNIIKFKLDLFPSFVEPQGIEYWQKVQNDFFEKYGREEHIATIKIAKEIGVDDTVMTLLESIGFLQAKENFETADFDKKIAAYSDMRVEPYGVVSLKERLRDGRKRTIVHKPNSTDFIHFTEMAKYLKKIETQIFEKTSISPDDVTDKKISIYLEKLRDFDISVHKS